MTTNEIIAESLLSRIREIGEHAVRLGSLSPDTTAFFGGVAIGEVAIGCQVNDRRLTLYFDDEGVGYWYGDWIKFYYSDPAFPDNLLGWLNH